MLTRVSSLSALQNRRVRLSVPFEDNHDGILSEIKKLGEKFDFLIGVCGSKAWLSLCSFVPLGRYRKMVAVPRGHPPAKKERPEIADLYGETLMMVPRGDSGVNDFLRNDPECNPPAVRIEDTPQFYDLSVFNRCAETGRVLLTVECRSEVHPGLVTIPVNRDYRIPYGLLYSFDADEDVRRLAEAMKERSPRYRGDRSPYNAIIRSVRFPSAEFRCPCP